jgi:multisubunit Na+/H+ antiporter MnhF subunit
VNAFTIAGMALLVGFVPLGVVAVFARAIDGVVALELCGVLATLVFLCLGEGFHRSAYFDVPIVCAVVSWMGGLVFARFLGRYFG